MSSGSLANKVVVVSGGGGGIGSAICLACAAAGASVVATYDQGEARANELVARLPGEGHLAVHAPVNDSQALGRLAALVAERYGTLDILVNNAGVTRPVPHADLDALDDELIDWIFRVNWRGAFASVRAMRALLAGGGGGLVINISSVAGQTGIGSNVAYCASKAALDSLTRSLGRALAPDIRVVSIAPGWVEGEYARRADPATLEEQRRRTPLGRIARPEDVADAVLAVATLLPFTTGSIIAVDGGRPLGT
jgi:3-oxoacyl-[acyl-carrier protein] reductase